MRNTRQVIQATLLCESFTNRSNILVMINHAKNERDRKLTSPYAKVGRVSGHTIRGWLRHAMEKLLIESGVSVCHPLPRISVSGGNSSKRNREYFTRDLALGYHARGECADQGGCLIYQIFGDLSVPGNLIVPSAYFYPTTTGNGTATKELNMLFGSVGGGRVEIAHCSPRARAQSHQTYMSIETVVGVMIKAPLNLILVEANPEHQVVIQKAMEFLKVMNQEYQYDFLLGGMRGQGYGRAAILPMKPKTARGARKTDQTTPDANEQVEPQDTGNNGGYTIQFKLTKPQSEKLEQKFQTIIVNEVAKFPLSRKEEVKVQEVSS